MTWVWFLLSSKGECPGIAWLPPQSVLGQPIREPWEGMQGIACLMVLHGLPPLQKQQHSGISGSANVRLLTCTICSCKSQSISTFLSCRNAFLNTVIYPQKSREQAPPSQNHVLLSTATLPYPTERPTQRKAQNPPPSPKQTATVHMPLTRTFISF